MWLEFLNHYNGVTLDHIVQYIVYTMYMYVYRKSYTSIHKDIYIYIRFVIRVQHPRYQRCYQVIHSHQALLEGVKKLPEYVYNGPNYFRYSSTITSSSEQGLCIKL